MFRRTVLASAAILLVTALHSDDAFARRGGGARAGGYRGGAVAARGYRGGAVAVRGGGVAGGYGYRGAYRAGAYRGYRAGAYRGYRYGAYRGVGAAAVGAAAVGAAAAGAYYRGGCGYDAYGNWVCPNGY